MVTITIKQEDIKPPYNNIEDWIECGINRDAMLVCVEEWAIKNNINTSDISYFEIRNKRIPTNKKYITSTKW